MRELMRSNDLVAINYAEALLRDAGLSPMVADQNMSVMEGSIGAFPRRLLVPDDVYGQARRILIDAELGEWIRD